MKNCKPKSKSILSLDVGIKRIGLAYCDSLFITVNILPAVKREKNNAELRTIKNHIKRLNLTDIKNLSFEEVNHDKFPSINYAYFALKYERGMPIVLNSANEVAVDAFLKKEITFDKIFKLIDRTMST